MCVGRGGGGEERRNGERLQERQEERENESEDVWEGGWICQLTHLFISLEIFNFAIENQIVNSLDLK